MAVPKRRTCPARRDKRRSHLALSAPAISVDRATRSVHRPHHVDLKTGMYRGRQVLFPTDDTGADA